MRSVIRSISEHRRCNKKVKIRHVPLHTTPKLKCIVCTYNNTLRTYPDDALRSVLEVSELVQIVEEGAHNKHTLINIIQSSRIDGTMISKRIAKRKLSATLTPKPGLRALQRLREVH